MQTEHSSRGRYKGVVVDDASRRNCDVRFKPRPGAYSRSGANDATLTNVGGSDVGGGMKVNGVGQRGANARRTDDDLLPNNASLA